MLYKYIGRIAALSLSIMLLAGCSDEKHIISYESGTVVSTDEASPSIAEDSITAALLLPDDPEGGACMSAAHADAFTAAAAELGIENAVTVIAEADSIPAEAADANVIFGAGYDYMNALDAAAKENPDKLYACFGGYKYNSTNYTNYYAAIYEAQYLAGIAAGTNTKSGKIGVISEYTSEYPDTAAEINSFALGARAANPDAKIFVCSFASRTDTSSAEKFTDTLIAKGCDVISIQANTSAPAEVAAKNDVYFIGYGSDMSSYGSKECLTSVVWGFEAYYKSALLAATDGTWADCGNFYGTVSDGTVTITSLSEDSDSVTAARIDSANELISGNLLEIFSNRTVIFDSVGKATVKNTALLDNKGNTMISEDGSSCFIYSGDELTAIDPSTVTSDALASASMNYLVEGVSVLN